LRESWAGQAVQQGARSTRECGALGCGLFQTRLGLGGPAGGAAEEQAHTLAGPKKPFPQGVDPTPKPVGLKWGIRPLQRGSPLALGPLPLLLPATGSEAKGLGAEGTGRRTGGLWWGVGHWPHTAPTAPETTMKDCMSGTRVYQGPNCLLASPLWEPGPSVKIRGGLRRRIPDLRAEDRCVGGQAPRPPIPVGLSTSYKTPGQALRSTKPPHSALLLLGSQVSHFGQHCSWPQQDGF
jgi:hypothetical protein